MNASVRLLCLLSLLSFTQAFTFTVYDCGHEHATFQKLTAPNRAGCRVAPGDFSRWENKRVQIFHHEQDYDIESTCQDKISGMYDGKATIRRVRGESGFEKAIVTIEHEDSGRLVGLKLQERRSVCNIDSYATNIAGVFLRFVSDGPEIEISFPRVEGTSKTHLLTMDFETYWRFEQVQEDICESERARLDTLLDHIANGNKHALTREYGPGYRFTMKGAVAYITKCVPVEAEITHVSDCTQETPVHLSEDVTKAVHFADPIDFTIRRFPVIIPCDSINPIMWLVDNRWFCSTSNVGGPTPVCHESNKLEPKGSTEGFSESANNGIYNSDQKEAHRHAQTTHDATEAAIFKIRNAAVSGAIQTVDGTWKLGKPLNNEEISWIKRLIWTELNDRNTRWRKDKWNLIFLVAMILLP